MSVSVFSVTYRLPVGDPVRGSYAVADFKEISRRIISESDPGAVRLHEAKLDTVDNALVMVRTIAVDASGAVVAMDALPSVITVGPYPFTLENGSVYTDPSGILGGGIHA